MTSASHPIDPEAARIRRLTFRAWRRGFKEADLILGTFADQHLSELDSQGLDEFERLLEVADQDLYAWITRRSPAPQEFDGPVMSMLQSFGYFARSLWMGRTPGG